MALMQYEGKRFALEPTRDAALNFSRLPAKILLAEKQTFTIFNGLVPCHSEMAPSEERQPSK
jgi:hypothetical protein